MKENYFLKFHNFSLYGFKKEKKNVFHSDFGWSRGLGQKTSPLTAQAGRVKLNWSKNNLYVNKKLGWVEFCDDRNPRYADGHKKYNKGPSNNQ